MSDGGGFMQRKDGKAILRSLFDAEALAQAEGFMPFRAGIEILPLYSADEARDEGKASAALLRYSPGASVPAHEHLGYEHVIVLQGSQRDEQGTYGRGCCVISAPGSRHSVTSDDGCVVLIIWSRPIAFLQAEAPVTPAAEGGKP